MKSSDDKISPSTIAVRVP